MIFQCCLAIFNPFSSPFTPPTYLDSPPTGLNSGKCQMFLRYVCTCCVSVYVINKVGTEKRENICYKVQHIHLINQPVHSLN